jgi:NAD(P)-dependent dehydrogenase (short-subunit alcohol dehydrogenase family)
MTEQNKGRIALVTGANRGIGLETVKQLAQQGMHVLLGREIKQKDRKPQRN